MSHRLSTSSQMTTISGYSFHKAAINLDKLDPSDQHRKTAHKTLWAHFCPHFPILLAIPPMLNLTSTWKSVYEYLPIQSNPFISENGISLKDLQGFLNLARTQILEEHPFLYAFPLCHSNLGRVVVHREFFLNLAEPFHTSKKGSFLNERVKV